MHILRIVNFMLPAALAFLVTALLVGNANAADILQSASGFAVPAGSTVTNTGPTVIAGMSERAPEPQLPAFRRVRPSGT